jgi:hypothetical protein
MIKYSVIAMLSIIIAYLLKDSSRSISYSSYEGVLSALMSVSSIVFAIIGAWIAIIYPRALGSFLKEDSEGTKSIEEDTNYLSDLVEIVLVSSFVLMTVLAILVAVPILREVVSENFIIILRQSGLGMIIFLALLQIFSIFRVVLTNYIFLTVLRSNIRNNKFSQIFKRRNKKTAQ